MSLIGETPYDHSEERKRYRGLVLTNPAFQNYLSNRVNEKYFDSQGRSNLRNIFQDDDSTGFISKNINSIIDDDEISIDWKMGEKISECFLEDNCDCIFPYNSSRDAKDPNSNLPGADIVGCVKINGESLFLFGEVKTSDQDQNPPSVIYGKDGLTEQLNEIKNKSKKRQNLIRWLGHKMVSLPDDDINKIAWKDATISYACNENFKIFGVLIRGTSPDERDLKSVFQKIILNMNNQIYLELLALYLPILKTEYVTTMGNQH